MTEDMITTLSIAPPWTAGTSAVSDSTLEQAELAEVRMCMQRCAEEDSIVQREARDMVAYHLHYLDAISIAMQPHQQEAVACPPAATPSLGDAALHGMKAAFANGARIVLHHQQARHQRLLADAEALVEKLRAAPRLPLATPARRRLVPLVADDAPSAADFADEEVEADDTLEADLSALEEEDFHLDDFSSASNSSVSSSV